MEESKLKNMVVLKNLPSNLIEEAIIVLKSNKKVKKLEKIDKDGGNESNVTRKDINKKDFVVKEAELVLSSYISKIENNNTVKQKKIEQNKKVKRLKNYAYLSSLVIFLQLMLLIIK